jgi:RNA polymerase sigma-70 factor (ECF subfamily)
MHSSLSQTPDEQLWLLVRDGNEAALEQLHRRHYMALLRYGRKICQDEDVVRDALQELFLQLWVRRQTLNAVQSVRFYLMKWMRRDLVRALKKNPDHLALDDPEAMDLAVSIHDFTEASQNSAQRKAAISNALKELSPREREVVYLRFFMQLTYEEICQVLSLPYQVVMNYISRALKALRNSPLLNKTLSLAVVLFVKIWAIAS